MKVNHGANLYDLSSQYGFSKEDFMDFSSNINPFGSSKLAKKYVINKQLFKLYWCLETLQNYYMEIDNIKLKQILEQGAAQSEYTIREKVAQIVRLAGGFEDLKNKLEQDENYYVRAIFNS